VVVVCLVLVTSVLIGVARGLGRPAAVCDASGTACTLLLQSDASPHTWGLIPVSAPARLRIRSGDRTDPIGIGIVGYLRADAATLLPTTTTTGSASVPPGGTAMVGLTGVPDGAA
jgi:hypothetical protein